MRLEQVEISRIEVVPAKLYDRETPLTSAAIM
jgi:hypothetical protein